MFDLVAHGPDTYVGTGPRYPWGGLYGGQVVAQALRAAALTVEPSFLPHSIRAYFIRPGDHDEPVRYEVDRIRNGRSFTTRRVVARQAIGAILNAECSFHRHEDSVQVEAVRAPRADGPDSAADSSFSDHFDRRRVDAQSGRRDGVGRVTAWMRVVHDLSAERSDASRPFIDQSWLAYLSDDLATDTVRSAARESLGDQEREFTGASLDHTIWFHAPLAADAWHLHDFTCHRITGARGLAVGHVFDGEGLHAATVAQEVLLREPRL